MLTAGLVILGVLYVSVLVGYRKAYLKRLEELDMNKCIECGNEARNKRSYLCRDCFDKALKSA